MDNVYFTLFDDRIIDLYVLLIQKDENLILDSQLHQVEIMTKEEAMKDRKRCALSTKS
jgi:hypothetical protein